MAESKHRRRAQKFSDQYAFQTRLIQHLIEDVTDDESLLQLPFESNCMNWILGHIISRRHSALEALGSDPFWAREQHMRYMTGSNPITAPDQAINFSKLIDELERSMDMLQTVLHDADQEIMDKVVVNDRGEKTAAEHLEGFLWHETYHIGQLEILKSFIESTR
jgi:hypothetical protein